MRRVWWSMLLALLPLVAVTHAGAQTASSIVVSYPAGWNMVGAPAGTSFSGAQSFYAYGSSGYVAVMPQNTSLCQGYYAYFATASSVTLANPSQSTSIVCALQAGWTMIGNPFAVQAQLPGGLTAFHWNPTAGTYDVVTSIPVGGAVWIESASASSVTLKALSPTVAPAVTISDLSSTGPFTLHVGQTIELLLPTAVGYKAVADPNYLILQSSGYTGPLSCLGDPACALNLINQFWIWQATSAGTTYIDVAPACRGVQPPCGQPSQRLQVVILP